MNKDVMNIHVYIFGWIFVFSFLETEFLGDRVAIYQVGIGYIQTLQEMGKLFSKVVAPFYSSTSKL